MNSELEAAYAKLAEHGQKLALTKAKVCATYNVDPADFDKLVDAASALKKQLGSELWQALTDEDKAQLILEAWNAHHPK